MTFFSLENETLAYLEDKELVWRITVNGGDQLECVFSEIMLSELCYL